ncbi:MAG: menaquinone biosynthesis decarboxylase, partial [Gammaproteobacteria bacterium]|nr:menaquinone biosynthesis decarboxylase [Gammaproteobacteria bacterium]NIT41910.1 menaquinone biosynthesis decarboxylase [Gammaproteobacteria bacterium]
MAPNDLSSFVALLEKTGGLSRISCQVDPNLEIAAIVDRACKSENGGKALL